MAVVWAAAGTPLSTTGASRSVATPASISAGDLLITTCSAQTGAITWTPPAGWTAMLSGSGQSVGTSSIQAFWRIADGTEGASQTFTCSSAVTTWQSVMHRYTGANQTTPIRGVGSSLNDTTTNAFNEYSRIPILAAGSLAVWWTRKTGVPTSGGTGWVQRYNNTTSGYSLWDQTVASAGYSDTLQLTYGAAWRAFPDFGFEICAAAAESARTAPHVRKRGLVTVGSSVTSISITVPKGMTVGNVAVIWLLPMGTGVTNVAATGWTVATAMLLSTNVEQVNLLWRVIDGTEGSTVSVSWTTASSPIAWMDEMGLCNTISPINNVQSTLQANSNTITASPSWTTAKPTVMAVTVSWYNGAADTMGLTTPNNWLEQMNNAQCIIAYQELATSGTSTGTGWAKTLPASALWGVTGFEFDFIANNPSSKAVFIG